jgi:hypothetical protein
MTLIMQYHERELQAVLDDALDGYITPAMAKMQYGGEIELGNARREHTKPGRPPHG